MVPAEHCAAEQNLLEADVIEKFSRSGSDDMGVHSLFAVWLMFGVIGIPIRRELGLNALEFGLLTSTL
jgi:hypothetical protein